ncbi:MAG: hypothetical protein IKA79_04435 [Lentisphaeria bacterium]|nr:hypothetical protein [Lentisphaeria bacterium]
MKTAVLCGDGVFFPEIKRKIPGNLKKKGKKQRKILPEGLIPENVRYIINEIKTSTNKKRMET